MASSPISPSPVSRRKYTAGFKAECVRQVTAGARQADVARAHGVSPTLLARWQRLALTVPDRAETAEIARLRAELRRVEQERDILKKSRAVV
ncbi:MAG: transposase [Hymenobacteraceae bacterium]|nr:transposase [Hymenobacteraceae bacterium]